MNAAPARDRKSAQRGEECKGGVRKPAPSLAARRRGRPLRRTLLCQRPGPAGRGGKVGRLTQRRNLPASENFKHCWSLHQPRHSKTTQKRLRKKRHRKRDHTHARACRGRHPRYAPPRRARGKSEWWGGVARATAATAHRDLRVRERAQPLPVPERRDGADAEARDREGLVGLGQLDALLGWWRERGWVGWVGAWVG